MSNYQLNPEIKKQFETLNRLIEQEIQASHEDTFAEAIRDTWGTELKNSKGYNMLEYATTLSKSEYERAVYDLEEAFYSMRDEEAAKLYNLYHTAMKVTGFWFDEDLSLQRKLELLEFWMAEMKKYATEVGRQIDSLWKYRSMAYREEIEDLREALKNKS